MLTAILALPLPLLLSLVIALPAPAPAPAPANNPSLLESYLDFNAIPANAELIPSPLNTKANINGHLSLIKRSLPPQAPLHPDIPEARYSEKQSQSETPTQTCKPPTLSQPQTNRLVSLLTAEMLSKHSHGIGFPYSTTTHCSSSVELTARRPVTVATVDETETGIGEKDTQAQWNAKLKVTLTPMGRDNYGMRRVHFASLLERIAEAGIGAEIITGKEEELEWEGHWVEDGKDGKEESRDVLEGVSGDVGFVARLVVSPVLGGGCLV